METIPKHVFWGNMEIYNLENGKSLYRTFELWEFKSSFFLFGNTEIGNYNFGKVNNRTCVVMFRF